MRLWHSLHLRHGKCDSLQLQHFVVAIEDGQFFNLLHSLLEASLTLTIVRRHCVVVAMPFFGFVRITKRLTHFQVAKTFLLRFLVFLVNLHGVLGTRSINLALTLYFASIDSLLIRLIRMASLHVFPRRWI